MILIEKMDLVQESEQLVEFFAILLARNAVEDEIEAVIAVSKQINDSGRYGLVVYHVERVQHDQRRHHADEKTIRAE
jgi:hypothetical protein